MPEALFFFGLPFALKDPVGLRSLIVWDARPYPCRSPFFKAHAPAAKSMESREEDTHCAKAQACAGPQCVPSPLLEAGTLRDQATQPFSGVTQAWPPPFPSLATFLAPFQECPGPHLHPLKSKASGAGQDCQSMATPGRLGG